MDSVVSLKNIKRNEEKPFVSLTHPARAKVMLKKTLHKKGVQRVYCEPMVVSKQALPKLCLLLPIVKKFKLLLVVNCHLFLHSKFTLLSFYTHYVT